MLNIDEIKNIIENFWLIYVVKFVSSYFFTLSGAPKPRKNIGDDKKLGDKKLVMHCIGFYNVNNEKTSNIVELLAFL